MARNVVSNNGIKKIFQLLKGKFALKSIYGDTTVNYGREYGTSVG